MFKVNFDKSGVAGKVKLDIEKAVNEIISDQELKTAVGEFAIQRLKYQARISRPITASKTLPKLKTSTIKNRAYLAKYNATHPAFELTRSNLTITGALIDSLKYAFGAKGVINFFFAGDHPRYLGKSGYIGKVVKNSQLAEWLAKRGFSMFDDQTKNDAQFTNRIRTICMQFIRRGLRVRNRL